MSEQIKYPNPIQKRLDKTAARRSALMESEGWSAPDYESGLQLMFVLMGGWPAWKKLHPESSDNDSAPIPESRVGEDEYLNWIDEAIRVSMEPSHLMAAREAYLSLHPQPKEPGDKAAPKNNDPSPELVTTILLGFAKWLDSHRDTSSPLWKDVNIWSKEGAFEIVLDAYTPKPKALPVEEGLAKFEYDKWMEEKFDERGRYKQTLEQWCLFNLGASEMFESIHPLYRACLKELSSLRELFFGWRELEEIRNRLIRELNVLINGNDVAERQLALPEIVDKLKKYIPDLREQLAFEKQLVERYEHTIESQQGLIYKKQVEANSFRDKLEDVEKHFRYQPPVNGLSEELYDCLNGISNLLKEYKEEE